ncbi:MAG TPA: phosphoribosyltransferase family protein [Solirubrobacterales bacterium]|nr:phosphoribosyltransferase family protein [Solirubrobacterales bacterium]
MGILQALATGLIPPLCAACGRSCRPDATLCTRCARQLAAAEPLEGAGPPGLDRAWSTAPHEAVARDLVTALKFRRLLPVADLMADRIQWLAPATVLSGTIVPVPTAPLRTMVRGFDPAAEIAAALAQRTELSLQTCLIRRGGGRQVGKRRAQRIGHPPRIQARGKVPGSVLLVDDVLTTGSTLSSCARALRQAGAIRVAAITFTRRL